MAQLEDPIGAGLGLAWLGAAVLVLAAAVLLALRIRWWWVAMVLAAGYGFVSDGPYSARAAYRDGRARPGF